MVLSTNCRVPFPANHMEESSAMTTRIVKNSARAVAAVAAVSLALTACGSDATPESTSGGTTTGAPAATGSVYYLNFKPEQAEQWVELAGKYTKETGVEVTVETAASGTYAATLKSEMAKSDPPSIFQVNGPVGLATWQDYTADLTDTALYKNLNVAEMALKSADGSQVSAVPYVIETYGLIYNKALLAKYFALPDAAIKSIDDLNNFAALKAVAEGIQANKDALGVDGAFTSSGFDPSSDWRFKTHLANMPLYYEFKADGITGQPETIKGSYLPNYKQIFDLYINNATVAPTTLSGKTMEDATAEFATGKAVFLQNGTWAYGDLSGAGMADDDLGMLPIYIGANGEENQGLTTGSENYWVINNKASAENQAASTAFLEWVITSETGQSTLVNDMGFVTPFSGFDDFAPTNPLVLADQAYTAAGKLPVSWNFTVMPSDEWKSGVGQALLEYAQGTGEWAGVETAFVDGWATEVQLANS